jgi:hypothetical protein
MYWVQLGRSCGGLLIPQITPILPLLDEETASAGYPLMPVPLPCCFAGAGGHLPAGTHRAPPAGRGPARL